MARTYTQITDEIRDNVLKLKNSGWKASEIADLMRIGPSTVSYIMQAYNAVKDDDWETVNRLKPSFSANIEWAFNRLDKRDPEFIPPKITATSNEIPEATISTLKSIDAHLVEVVDKLTELVNLLH